MVNDKASESIHAQDLRRMAFLMETRHGSVMKFENNLRVLRRLREFFVEDVAGHLGPLKDSHADEIRTHIKGFAEKLTLVMAEIEEWRLRVSDQGERTLNGLDSTVASAPLNSANEDNRGVDGGRLVSDEAIVFHCPDIVTSHGRISKPR